MSNSNNIISSSSIKQEGETHANNFQLQENQTSLPEINFEQNLPVHKYIIQHTKNYSDVLESNNVTIKLEFQDLENHIDPKTPPEQTCSTDNSCNVLEPNNVTSKPCDEHPEVCDPETHLEETTCNIASTVPDVHVDAPILLTARQEISRKLRNSDNLIVLKTVETQNKYNRSKTCNICKKYFSSISSLNRHKRNVHTKLAISESDESPDPENHIDPVTLLEKTRDIASTVSDVHTDEPFCPTKSKTCEICAKLFCSSSSMNRHKRNVHSKGKTQECEAETRPEPKDGYVCEYCGQHFQKRELLYQHHRNFHLKEISILKCELCEKRLPTKHGLRHHMLSHMKDICQVCGKKFWNFWELQKHRRRVHKGGPFTCEICGKGFFLADSWRCHVNVHQEDNNFCCHMCGYTFSDKNSLEKHILLKHADTS